MVALLIKRLFSLSVIAVFLSIFTFAAYCVPDTSAQCAVVMNADTYEVVYEKNAHKIQSMASTTKIMTSLLAIESGKLNEVVTVKEKLAIEGTSIGAKQGYKYKLIDLVYGMMLQSGNDAAYLTATFISGNEENFAVLMNKKAAEIGMTNTNFVTSSGLDNENHYTTAYDMALLGCHAVNNEVFREICSTKNKSINLISPDISVTFSNHNKLLSSCDGVFGVKTGFTKKSGRCLVSACERDNVTYVAVTLNAPNDWSDHKNLYDYVFENTKMFEAESGISKIKTVYGGTKSSVEIEYDKIFIPYIKSNGFDVRVYMPKIIYAPVKKGDIIGCIDVYLEQQKICTENIYAAQDVECIESEKKTEISFFNKIINLFRKQK